MPINAASILTTAENHLSVIVTGRLLSGRDGITPTRGHSDGAFWKSELQPNYCNVASRWK